MRTAVFIAAVIVCVILSFVTEAEIAAQDPASAALSIPEFSLLAEAHPYYVPPIYGIDEQTREKITVQEGRTVGNQTVIAIVKNQPFSGVFNGSQAWLVYNVRAKLHSADAWGELYTFNAHFNISLPHQSDSGDTTDLWCFCPYGSGVEVDFQVRAYIMYTAQVPNEGRNNTTAGYALCEPSDWSSTRTITIPEVSPSPNPSPSPIEPPFSFNTGSGDFSIVVLPDAQGYTKYYPWIFDNQTRWIIDNKEAFNIVFVSQLGDLVDQTDNKTQWENANRSLSTLDGNIPWAVLPGNHDMYGVNITNYQTYFGYGRFSGEGWYGGAFEDNNTNSYELFSASGNRFLILHLQYNTSDATLAWAGNVISQHPQCRVIVSTHDYMTGWNGLGQRSAIGEKIWQDLIKPHAEQVFLVLCGHAGAEDMIVDTVDGHVVYQVLSDFAPQASFQGGWLRLLEFSPQNNKVYVRTYSPLFHEYKQDPQSEFVLDYNMRVSADQSFPTWIVLPLILIGALLAVLVARRRRGNRTFSKPSA